VVVLQTGNAVNLPWAGKVGAIVQAWYAGQRGGEAIARVLTGEVNPSGRLPLTWARSESQLPRPVIPGTGAAPDARVTVDYNIEGSDIGYRWFARERLTPLYWFGHGLSYTRFGYEGLSVTGGATIEASVTVTNTGDKPGKEVVQLYLTGAPDRSERRLLGFEKVDLAPGESKRVTLAADPRLLANYDVARRGWVIAPGAYQVAVGTDAGTMTLSGRARLSGRTLKP
jgi:beta-glucosidase